MSDEKKDLEGGNPASLHKTPSSLSAPAVAVDEVGVNRSRYAHPLVQIIFLSFICFGCPGLYNALSGIGGGGQVDTKTQSNASVALYSTFAVTGFFGGNFCNKFGPRMTLQIGTLGYCLYIGAFLSYNINGNSGFVIASGAILGVCAGLLWTAQGSIMLAYATEATKGRYIAVFWSIFNMGAVLGSAIALGQNAHQVHNAPVENGTYIAFLIITLCAAALPFFLVKPESVIRSDGSRVAIPQHPSWKTEFTGMWWSLTKDPYIILLFPFFLASNWFYTYQGNCYNAALFNTRTRALNGLLYWFVQIVGAILFGFFLDNPRLSRRNRAFAGFAFLFAIIMITYGWGYLYQKDYTRASVSEAAGYIPIDWSDSAYAGRVLLHILYGMTDAFWQTYAYWVIGTVSNDVRRLAHLAGFYKGIQSAGAAGVWRLDAEKKSYMSIFGSTWGLCAGSLVLMLPFLISRVTEHTNAEDEIVQRMDDKGGLRDAKEIQEAGLEPTK
ncbi:MFS general substrate transporter [Atractiella rhizophila]|nr:MFS general substrate transporter [Atractiella rhizophila]